MEGNRCQRRGYPCVKLKRCCASNGPKAEQPADCQSCGIGRPTVSEYLRRAAEAGLVWPLPADLDDGLLERRLFPPPPDLPAESRGIPDWPHIHQELKHKSVTLFLLWQEYRQAHPNGYQYSWFCEHYRSWQGKLDVVMRQDHRAWRETVCRLCGPDCACRRSRHRRGV